MFINRFVRKRPSIVNVTFMRMEFRYYNLYTVDGVYRCKDNSRNYCLYD